MNKLMFSILLVCLFGSLSWGQLPNSNKTLLHTQTAKTFDAGLLSVYSNMNFYTKAGEFIGEIKPEDFKTMNYWLVAGNGIFTYGIIDHFDATLAIRVYQDTHKSNEYNFPDDIFLTLRAGSFTFGRNHYNNAFLASFRFPTGEEHNYPFAEYASGALEYGFMYALSYYKDPYLPERAFSVHFNLGWWNHNEAGTTIYKYDRNYGDHLKGDELKATVNSKEVRLALAAVLPAALFDFRLELSGMLYITKPDEFVYSAEEWAFLTPSIRYKPVKWLSLDLGADFRLSPGDREWTTYDIPKPSTNLDLPSNYPNWKVHMGAEISFNLWKKGMDNLEYYEQEEEKEKIELFESIIEEREKADTVQEEIENLKKIRKGTEKEIEELKKILED